MMKKGSDDMKKFILDKCIAFTEWTEKKYERWSFLFQGTGKAILLMIFLVLFIPLN